MDYLFKKIFLFWQRALPNATIFRPFRAEIGSPERAKYAEE
jgi:hypothetical protein